MWMLSLGNQWKLLCLVFLSNLGAKVLVTGAVKWRSVLCETVRSCGYAFGAIFHHGGAWFHDNLTAFNVEYHKRRNGCIPRSEEGAFGQKRTGLIFD